MQRGFQLWRLNVPCSTFRVEANGCLSRSLGASSNARIGIHAVLNCQCEHQMRSSLANGDKVLAVVLSLTGISLGAELFHESSPFLLFYYIGSW